MVVIVKQNLFKIPKQLIHILFIIFIFSFQWLQLSKSKFLIQKNRLLRKEGFWGLLEKCEIQKLFWQLVELIKHTGRQNSGFDRPASWLRCVGNLTRIVHWFPRLEKNGGWRMAASRSWPRGSGGFFFNLRDRKIDHWTHTNIFGWYTWAFLMQRLASPCQGGNDSQSQISYEPITSECIFCFAKKPSFFGRN